MSYHDMQQSEGIFQAGHGSIIQIHGGHFVQHNQAQNAHKCHEAKNGLKHLQAHVVTSAFDSPEHVDAPKCHPNTRKVVLDDIINWITLTVTRVQWVLWLNGAAGAGKSAIGRSIVDLCRERKIPIARFFFFRTDSTRNNIRPLVATLAHQLLQSIPALKPIIIPKIKSDSLIFTKSLKTQLEFLIFDPLCELERNFLHFHTLVLLFDGVDECDNEDDQVSLIRIVAEFARSTSNPAIAFFASRTEDQISTVFRSAALSKITLHLQLDNKYLPDDDIRVFLDDSFDEIKHTHPYARLLDGNWPTTSEVEEIVEKSSGQFIYASVVIKFCSMLRLHPEQQLKIVRGLRPRGTLTPFAQLDALYQHIFSQIRDLEATSLVLAWTIFTPKNPLLENCAEFLLMQTADIYVALAPLQSVVDCTSTEDIHFLHASLPDFLLDKDRSQKYYINRSTWSTRLAVMAYMYVMSKGDRFYTPGDMYLTEAEATPELRKHVLTYNPEKIKNVLPGYFINYLKCVQRLDFGDGPGGTVYQQQLDVIVRYVKKNCPIHLYKIHEVHEISNILSQIRGEPVPMAVTQEWPATRVGAIKEFQKSPRATEEWQGSTATNERQKEIKKQSSTARKIFGATWKSKDRRPEAREAGIRQEEGGSSSPEREKSSLSRLFRK